MWKTLKHFILLEGLTPIFQNYTTHIPKHKHDMYVTAPCHSSAMTHGVANTILLHIWTGSYILANPPRRYGAHFCKRAERSIISYLYINNLIKNYIIKFLWVTNFNSYKLEKQTNIECMKRTHTLKEKWLLRQPMGIYCISLCPQGSVLLPRLWQVYIPGSFYLSSSLLNYKVFKMRK